MRKNGPKMDHLDWDALRTALALARAGSIRAAARTLGVSHSTILRRVEALESATRARLFERTTAGFELTTAGQDVFDTAQRVEDAVLGLERRVEGRDAKLSGPIRVTLPDPLMSLMLPAFRAFARAHPAIEVTAAVGVGFADLAHREADVALRYTDAPPPDLVGRKLAFGGCAIYGAKSYLARRSTKDLQALDWVGWEEGSTMAFARWMREHVPRARVALRVSSGWAIGDAVEAGVGVALLPCARGEIRPSWRRLAKVKEVGAPIWILTHPDLRTTARVRVLRDFLVEYLLANRAVIEGHRGAERA